ncbi:pseudouridine synthase [Roseateles sp. BYS180W]|uniref:Dual-specificity RNA pseudouridine synthase RluF n=1 Tax=Roseateles rivi TaxID=3299028 RepID=A0ABW7FZI1_9BURK
MATITLKNKAPAARKSSSDRAPLRGKGVARPRQTLEQAQAERAERAQRLQREAQGPAPRYRDDAPPRGGGRPGDRRSDRPMDRPLDRPFDRSADHSHGRDTGRAQPQRFDPRGEAPRRRDDNAAPWREQRGPQDRQERYEPRGARPQGPGNGSGPGPRHPANPTREPAGWSERAPQQRPAAAPSAQGERLSKRMSELGLASRREADEWIAAGWVRVNGRMAELGQRVLPDVRIDIDPAARQQQAQRVTILLHKPIGYVSGQAEDGYEPASVLVQAANHWGEDASGLQWAPGHGRGLAPAGRLDIDSTGLLVLTQDGRVAKALIGEDSPVEKEYLVRVAPAHNDDGSPAQHQMPPQTLRLLNHGLELDGVKLRPAKVSWANEDQLRFVLREGRKRQIRRMCELVGLKVLALKRVRIGRIPLGALPPGQWRYLAPWERFD